MNINELVAILRDRSEGLARMALNNHDSAERNRLLGKCEGYNDCANRVMEWHLENLRNKRSRRSTNPNRTTEL